MAHCSMPLGCWVGRGLRCDWRNTALWSADIPSEICSHEIFFFSFVQQLLLLLYFDRSHSNASHHVVPQYSKGFVANYLQKHSLVGDSDFHPLSPFLGG